MTLPARRRLQFASAIFATLLLFAAVLLTGGVPIPARDVLGALLGDEGVKASWRTIVVEARLPFAVTALLAGAALSVAGLMLQTTFRNPLAGPSIMGISSGASLGVAVIVLGDGGLGLTGGSLAMGSAIVGALLGAAAILLLLSLFSSVLKSTLGLLIIGIMISYLSNSLVSLLNFFAPAEGVRNFMLWGMGSFSAVTLRELPWMALTVTAMLAASCLVAKPLNAMLLGDRYMATMGYRVARTRSLILLISGTLTAVATAFCGPIGFIGLVVPHIARLLFSTSMHNVLLPGCIILGAATALLCALLSVLPASAGIIPINIITPIIGVPVIVYIMVNSRKLKYFN